VDKFLKEQLRNHEFNFDKDYCFLNMVRKETLKDL
jgi:hypothetical protein